MTINTYLFDMDDTLIDTKIYAELYNPIINRIKSEFSITDSELDEKAERLGLKRNKNGRWDTGDLCRGLGLLDMYYEELEAKIQVMPVLFSSVEEVFKKLKKRGKRIGIVSNSMIRTIKVYLDRYTLSKYVDFIFSVDDAGCQKNDRKYWTKLIVKEKLISTECLTIGDNHTEDVLIPKEFGFNTLHIIEPEDLKSVLDI